MKESLPDGLFQLLGAVKQRTVRLLAPAAGVESLPVHLHQLFGRLGIDCVLDVGANRGQYARLLRRIGYRGRIVSFEPLPECQVVLRRLAAGDPKWTVVPIALGAEDGTRTLNVTLATEFSSFLTPSDYGRRTFPGVQVTRTEEVPVRRLDGVWTEYVGRDERVHLKLDTQGADPQVLLGARDVVGLAASLQTEASVKVAYKGMYRYPEAIANIEALGFELTGLFPVVRDPDLRVIEMDCVFRSAAEAANG